MNSYPYNGGKRHPNGIRGPENDEPNWTYSGEFSDEDQDLINAVEPLIARLIKWLNDGLPYDEMHKIEAFVAELIGYEEDFYNFLSGYTLEEISADGIAVGVLDTIADQASNDDAAQIIRGRFDEMDDAHTSLRDRYDNAYGAACLRHGEDFSASFPRDLSGPFGSMISTRDLDQHIALKKPLTDLQVKDGVALLRQIADVAENFGSYNVGKLHLAKALRAVYFGEVK